jgi:osmoprotectant transport system permease protein
MLTAGCISLACSLAVLPVISIKPNRVSSGTGLRLAAVFPEAFVLMIIMGTLLFLFLFLLSRIPKTNIRDRGASSSFIEKSLVLLVLLTLWTGIVVLPALLARALETDPGKILSLTGLRYSTSMRFALGSGFWLAFLSAVVIQAGFRPFLDASHWAFRTLVWAGAIVFALSLALIGAYDGISIVKEYILRRATFSAEFLRHAAYALFPTSIALALAIPLGRLGAKNPGWDRPFFFIANIAQVIPTLALIGFLIGPLAAIGRTLPGLGIRGVGWAPASFALFLYALLPLLANSKAGFAMIDPAVLDVAKGMGMSDTSIFFSIELPLAATAIVGGFRTALAQNMGNAVLAGLVGGGGLGSLIFLGLAQAAPDLVTLGALAVALSAFGVDKIFGWLEHRVGRIAGMI